MAKTPEEGVKTLRISTQRWKAKKIQAWEGIEDAVEYIQTILANNRGRRQEALDRSDVKAVLLSLRSRALDVLGEYVGQAWDVGTRRGRRQAYWELSYEGIKVVYGEPNDAVLKLLHEDVDRLIKDVLTEIVMGQEPERVRARAELRSGMILEAATKESEFQSKGATIGASGHKVVWQSKLGPTTCSHCKNLHGVEVSWGDTFPSEFPGLRSLGVYGGALLGPPRHPSCECWLTVGGVDG